MLQRQISPNVGRTPTRRAGRGVSSFGLLCSFGKPGGFGRAADDVLGAIMEPLEGGGVGWEARLDKDAKGIKVNGSAPIESKVSDAWKRGRRVRRQGSQILSHIEGM